MIYHDFPVFFSIQLPLKLLFFPEFQTHQGHQTNLRVNEATSRQLQMVSSPVSVLRFGATFHED
jgi:hypothetical protein